MLPDLFSIGNVTIHTYGFFVAIGLSLGIIVSLEIGKSHGINPPHIIDMGLVIVISALVGSRLAYVLSNVSYYRNNPASSLKIWDGGLIFSGGLVFAILIMAWYAKRLKISPWLAGDIWAPALALGQGIGRLGCLMAGCCYGKPTTFPWGIRFTNPDSLAPINVTLHPTQLYSSLSGFLIFLILMALNSRKKFNGQVFLWMLILHSTSRLLVERFRGDFRSVFLNSSATLTQFLTTVILTASVITLLYLKSRETKPPKSEDLK